MAQTILSVIATSTMTVVSSVFAILLMTLTLASMQFSPRILISFVRDQGTQWTLGIFLGTFTYCLAAMPAARSVPQPFAPVLTGLGAMLLALISVGWLLFFIHHISHAISVNHIVDRVARETEEVIDTLPGSFFCRDVADNRPALGWPAARGYRNRRRPVVSTRPGAGAGGGAGVDAERSAFLERATTWQLPRAQSASVDSSFVNPTMILSARKPRCPSWQRGQYRALLHARKRADNP